MIPVQIQGLQTHQPLHLLRGVEALLTPPALRGVKTNEWQEEDDTEADPRVARLEPRELELTLYIATVDLADLRRRFRGGRPLSLELLPYRSASTSAQDPQPLSLIFELSLVRYEMETRFPSGFTSLVMTFRETGGYQPLGRSDSRHASASAHMTALLQRIGADYPLPQGGGVQYLGGSNDLLLTSPNPREALSITTPTGRIIDPQPRQTHQGREIGLPILLKHPTLSEGLVYWGALMELLTTPRLHRLTYPTGQAFNAYYMGVAIERAILLPENGGFWLKATIKMHTSS